MSNKISATCKQCHKTYKVSIQFVGKTIHCKCGHRFKCPNTSLTKAYPPPFDSRGTVTRHQKDQRDLTQTKSQSFFTPQKLIAKNAQSLSFDTVFIRKNSTQIGIAFLLLGILAFIVLIANTPRDTPTRPRPDSPPATADLIDSALKSVVTLLGTTSLGSGFLFQDSQTIITNLHVVKNQKHMTARFDNGQTIPISGWYKISPEHDLAILRLSSPAPRQPLPIFSGVIKSGMRIFAIGAPVGLGFTVTDGLVSATRDGNDLEKAIGPLDAIDTSSKWIQFSAPISSGNSGGPLILENGEAIGVNTMGITNDSGQVLRQNLNFAIHIDHAIDLYKQIPRQPRSFEELP